MSMEPLNMDPKIRKEWVAALRSGDYPQTTGRLHDTAGYCCLGVLCEIAAQAGVVEATAVDEGNTLYGTGDDVCDETLPAAVVKWAGLTESVPYMRVTEWVDASLIALNDDHGFTFDEIADVIDGLMDRDLLYERVY